MDALLAYPGRGPHQDHLLAACGYSGVTCLPWILLGGPWLTLDRESVGIK